MARQFMPVAFSGLLSCVLLLQSAAVRPAAPVKPQAVSVCQAEQPIEVRLRRLHLVRPDLIMYPIAYEVDC